MKLHLKQHDLRKLFLICVFPLQSWTIYMTFQDVEWVAARTNIGDAIGYWGYAMLFSLFEIILAWIFLLILNFLIPKQWGRQIRISLLGSIVFVLAIWSALGRLYFLTGQGTPEFFLDFAIWTGHPLWVLYGTVLTSITASIAIPMFLLVRYPKIRDGLLSIFNRVAVLSGLYLVLDFFGIAIVIARNLL
jgi:hypothetical protein